MIIIIVKLLAITYSFWVVGVQNSQKLLYV